MEKLFSLTKPTLLNLVSGLENISDKFQLKRIDDKIGTYSEIKDGIGASARILNSTKLKLGEEDFTINLREVKIFSTILVSFSGSVISLSNDKGWIKFRTEDMDDVWNEKPLRDSGFKVNLDKRLDKIGITFAAVVKPPAGVV